MSKQTINIGASPNDGTGTPLRTSFDYTNQNFTELYTALGGGVGLPGATTQVIFNDGGTNLAGDAGLVYNKTTDALTVAGLVTAGSATITGDLTVDTSTLKVDAANDNVIVGATSAIGGGRFSVQADLSAKQGICVKNSAASYGASNNLIRFTNSSDATVGGITHPAVTSLGVWGVSDIQFLLSGAATTAMTLNSTGNLVLKGGTAAANGVGVTFPATQVASSDANTLDDYEEGTFTPNIGGTATYTTQTGRYTKIGNRVYFTITLEILLAGTGEDYRISGLPFTAAVNSSASIGYFGLLKSNQTFLSGQILGNQVYFAGTTVATASMTNAPGVIGNGTNLLMSGFFNV